MNTTAFLTHLATLYPAPAPLRNPYDYVAGIVFAAQNRPAAAAAAYAHGLAHFGAGAAAATTRVFREALFKTGVLYGAPRMINALAAVKAAIPAALPDAPRYRYVRAPPRARTR